MDSGEGINVFTGSQNRKVKIFENIQGIYKHFSSWRIINKDNLLNNLDKKNIVLQMTGEKRKKHNKKQKILKYDCRQNC